MGQETDDSFNLQPTVYKHLSETNETNKKWTLYLILCCLSACMGSFNFGYNIGSTNLPTPLIKDFFSKQYFKEMFLQQAKYENETSAFISIFNEKNITSELTSLNNTLPNLNNNTLKERNSNINKTIAELKDMKIKLDAGKAKKQSMETLIWTFTTSLFVVGGMIGAFSSKYVLEYFGRKKGIIFHYVFTISGSILVLIAPAINFPSCVLISRFFFGVQGGMMCGLIPTYLNEISPKALRGATGVLSQLFITVGILVAQTLGFRQFLGTKDHWHILLALPIVPSLIGGIALIFFPESPKALLLNKKNKSAATKALKLLRNSDDVSSEIEEINLESKASNSSEEAVSLKELFTSQQLRWPLITGLVLNITQQLCGINAIFFYSEGIFKRASIESEYIQYAVFATGLVNVISTIAVVPLIDRLGRKPLLVVPMAIIIVDFIVLTICLVLQKQSIYYSYMSIVCIVIFIMCFAFGLGPIPFIYVAECFRQDARGAAIAICMLSNWVANLLLTLTFEYMAMLLTDYVFLIFAIIVSFALFVIIKKVPETKGRNLEEIMEYFEGGSSRKYNKDIQLVPNPVA